MPTWVGAGVLVAAGAITIVIGLFTPIGIASFGWFAYQPLADATFIPGGSAVVLSHIAVAGWAIFAAGLVMLAFLTGRAAARSTTAARWEVASSIRRRLRDAGPHFRHLVNEALREAHECCTLEVLQLALRHGRHVRSTGRRVRFAE